MRTGNAPLGRLRGKEARRLLRLGGLLARPALAKTHEAEVLRLLNDPAWRPVPLTAPIYFAFPLIVHHAERLGFRADDVFASGDGLAVRPPTFESLMRSDCARRAMLTRALELLADAGIERAVLLKGAALAPLWPSPALRDMEDIDLAVATVDRPRASAALERAGWERRGFAFSKPGACAIDLVTPSGAFAEGLLAHAVPHSSFPGTIAHLPRAGDHLALIALHCAHHRGARIWRDVADWLFLCGDGTDRQAMADAWEAAAAQGHRGLVAAMHRTAARWFAPVEPLPLRGPEWTDDEERETRRFAALYTSMLLERLSEFPLRTVQAWLARGRSHPGRSGNAPRHRALPGLTQRDLLFGTIGGRSRLARQRAKAAILWRLWRSGSWRHYVRLARLAEPAVALERPFEDSRADFSNSRRSRT